MSLDDLTRTADHFQDLLAQSRNGYGIDERRGSESFQLYSALAHVPPDEERVAMVERTSALLPWVRNHKPVSSCGRLESQRPLALRGAWRKTSMAK
jgi:hypothetical protein